MWSLIGQVLDPSARFPAVPFRSRSGCIAVGEEFGVLGSDCVSVFHALSAAHGDDEIVVVSVDPPGSEWARDYGFFPGFRFAPDVSSGDYWGAMTYSPEKNAEMWAVPNVLAWAGSSGKWGAWVERGWELALVWAVEPWDWSESSLAFAPPLQALEEFAYYDPESTTLTPEEVESFVRNVEAYDVVADTD